MATQCPKTSTSADSLFEYQEGTSSHPASNVDNEIDRHVGSEVGIGNPTVEHVLPQTPEAGSQWLVWWPVEDVRKRWTHRLGNLLLLTQRKNSQASRFEFDEKKKKYFQTKGGVTDFPITTAVLAEKTWDPTVVDRRQTELLALLANHWAG